MIGVSCFAWGFFSQFSPRSGNWIASHAESFERHDSTLNHMLACSTPPLHSLSIIESTRPRGGRHQSDRKAFAICSRTGQQKPESFSWLFEIVSNMTALPPKQSNILASDPKADISAFQTMLLCNDIVPSLSNILIHYAQCFQNPHTSP